MYQGGEIKVRNERVIGLEGWILITFSSDLGDKDKGVEHKCGGWYRQSWNDEVLMRITSYMIKVPKS